MDVICKDVHINQRYYIMHNGVELSGPYDNEAAARADLPRKLTGTTEVEARLGWINSNTD